MSNRITITRPHEEACAPFYRNYIEQVRGEDALAVLRANLETTADFLRSIPVEKWNQAYAPGKWTLKESFIHLIDSERVFAYRALRIARNDQTPLAGFEQDDYIPYYQAEQRSPASIIKEYRSVRQATISLFENLDAAALDRSGEASGSAVTVRALAWMIAGHEQHHLNLTKEKYL